MATIRKREGKKGTSYQVQVRLKGGEMETASFKSLTKVNYGPKALKPLCVKAGTSQAQSQRNIPSVILLSVSYQTPA